MTSFQLQLPCSVQLGLNVCHVERTYIQVNCFHCGHTSSVYTFPHAFLTICLPAFLPMVQTPSFHGSCRVDR